MMFLFVLNLNLVNAEERVSNDATKIYSANYIDDYETADLLETFDYAFIGKVTSLVGSSQYNGNGMEIPYTFFNVKITNVKKGELASNIVIKFYGGYDEENKMARLVDETNEDYLYSLEDFVLIKNE